MPFFNFIINKTSNISLTKSDFILKQIQSFWLKNSKFMQFFMIFETKIFFLLYLISKTQKKICLGSIISNLTQ
ncbi:MAG: hypothetical protein EAZ97_03035 [Bacteroidetes bacterium]|nr:MAG: hypothetical protein EAZ97_03035 [Bacteroidota bacterium]